MAQIIWAILIDKNPIKSSKKEKTITKPATVQSLPAIFQLGDWRVDANQNLLFQDEQRVSLEPKAMAILQYLAIHADNIVTRETLFDQFWPNQVVTADALNRAMSNIRRALGDSSNNPQYVATIRNQGYKKKEKR